MQLEPISLLLGGQPLRRTRLADGIVQDPLQITDLQWCAGCEIEGRDINLVRSERSSDPVQAISSMWVFCDNSPYRAYPV